MRAIIIHRWGADSTSDWVPWLKEELEKNGIAAEAPDMPNTDKPRIEEWTGEIASAVNEDNDVTLVGHSIGCQAIVRYLSSLPEGRSMGSVFLVAPWTDLRGIEPESEEIARPWTETPIDWNTAKSRAKSFTVLYSDDDVYVDAENAISFGKNLGAKAILDSKRGHFSDEDDVTQLPELLKAILAAVK